MGASRLFWVRKPLSNFSGEIIMTFLPKPPIDNLDIFLSKCHRRRYPSKSTIIYAGDKADVLYFIVKGTVSVLVEEQKDIKRWLSPT